MNYTKDTQRKVKEIKKIIESDFDGRAELALFNYIFEKGIENLKKVSDEDIEKQITEDSDSAIFGKDFLIAMIKTAVKLSKEFEPVELLKYVRMELWMVPAINEVYAYRNSEGTYEIEESMNFDLEERETVKLHVIIEEEE